MESTTVSVIMSIYNETEEELKKSIASVLTQTYENIEFIIINDNPESDVNKTILSSINDQRVKIYHNPKNVGLVNSLNFALIKANGDYIARMDADDISLPNRIKSQLTYLKKYRLDIIGGWIKIIDESDNIIGSMQFPKTDKFVKKCIKYGGCVPHPTWLVKREIYDALKGYRNIPSCEDYDFLNRAIYHGYKIGNIPEYVLKYRVRNNSVSFTNQAQQLITRRFISDNRKKILDLTEKRIFDFMSSPEYRKKIKQIEQYEQIKRKAKDEKSIKYFCLLFFQEPFYRLVKERLCFKLYTNR